MTTHDNSLSQTLTSLAQPISALWRRLSHICRCVSRNAQLGDCKLKRLTCVNCCL